MVFSSVTFLCFFLPITMLGYRLVPRRARNALLLGASLVFYTWGAGWFVLVLLGSIAVNYVFGLGIERAIEADRRDRAKAILAAGVILNVGILAWFKYANFAVSSLDGVLAMGGGAPLEWATILLPIGISFYTFHSLSYLVDLYRGVARHLRHPVDFALYISFFPQLVAGPIVRFHEIRDQLIERREDAPTFAAGAARFCWGLAKKVLIADTIAPVADAVFATPPGELHTAAAVLGVVAYTVQLYFDFSGYSDMAIGLGMMFGFHLPENFARPYASRSVTEFWRRWHMSLSRWFRDYLYIPLGGNRGTPARTYANLIFVFLVTGLWHGAAWTFVLWGLYHGVLLLIERRLGVGRGPLAAPSGEPATPTPRAGLLSGLAQTRTVLLVVLGWILFRSADLPSALGFYGALLRPGLDLPVDVALALDPLATIALAIGVSTVVLPAGWISGVRIQEAATRPARVLRLASVVILLPASMVFLVAAGFSPFLYFQF